MSELFSQKNLYNLCKDTKFCSYNVKTVYYRTGTLSYLGPKIWNLVSPEIKNPETLIFQKKMKNGGHLDAQVGFANLILDLGFVNISYRYLNYVNSLR